MVFIPLVYNSGDQNVLINDWYTCLQVLSKQLTVWNAYLSLLGYNLVIAPVFPLNRPRTGIEVHIMVTNGNRMLVFRDFFTPQRATMCIEHKTTVLCVGLSW